MDRHDARRDRDPDTGRAAAFKEAQIVRVVEAELGDDAVGTRINLGFQIVDVGLQRRAFGMLFR